MDINLTYPNIQTDSENYLTIIIYILFIHCFFEIVQFETLHTLDHRVLKMMEKKYHHETALPLSINQDQKESKPSKQQNLNDVGKNRKKKVFFFKTQELVLIFYFLKKHFIISHSRGYIIINRPTFFWVLSIVFYFNSLLLPIT